MSSIYELSSDGGATWEEVSQYMFELAPVIGDILRRNTIEGCIFYINDKWQGCSYDDWEETSKLFSRFV